MNCDPLAGPIVPNHASIFHVYLKLYVCVKNKLLLGKSLLNALDIPDRNGCHWPAGGLPMPRAIKIRLKVNAGLVMCFSLEMCTAANTSPPYEGVEWGWYLHHPPPPHEGEGGRVATFTALDWLQSCQPDETPRKGTCTWVHPLPMRWEGGYHCGNDLHLLLDY